MQFQTPNQNGRPFSKHSRLLDIQANLQQQIMRDKEAKLLQLAQEGEEKNRMRLKRLAYDRNDSAPTFGSKQFYGAYRQSNSADQPHQARPVTYAHNKGHHQGGRLPVLKPLPPRDREVVNHQTHWAGTSAGNGSALSGIPRQEVRKPSHSQWKGDDGPVSDYPNSQHVSKPPPGLRKPGAGKQSRITQDIEKSRLAGERRRAEIEAKREAARKKKEAEEELRRQQQEEESQRQEEADEAMAAEQQEREELIKRLEAEEKRKLKELEEMHQTHKQEQIKRFGQLASKYDVDEDRTYTPEKPRKPTRKIKVAKDVFKGKSHFNDESSYSQNYSNSPHFQSGDHETDLNTTYNIDKLGQDLYHDRSVSNNYNRTNDTSNRDSSFNTKQSSYNSSEASSYKQQPVAKPKEVLPFQRNTTQKSSKPPPQNQPTEFFDEETQEMKTLVPCSVCSRRFAEDRIEKHEIACSKAAAKKRKVFDPTKQRLAGSGAEGFQNPKGRKMKQKEAPKRKSNWRQTHQEFIRTIRYAKQLKEHEEAGGNISSLPPPPRSENPDYVQCPHCSRRFNQAAAERHIPRCKDIKAKPKALTRKR